MHPGIELSHSCERNIQDEKIAERDTSEKEPAANRGKLEGKYCFSCFFSVPGE